AEYERVANRYASGATVPGFRKGRAPVSVVRQRYKNEIRGDVIQQLVPQAISDAITENELRVLGEPDIHLDNDAGLDKLGEEPLSVHAHVEVMPEVALGDYKGFELARRTRPVTDEMVEEVINDLRESSASLEPVEDRGAQDEDTVTVDFVGRYIQPPADEDIKAEDVEVVLGSEGVLPIFNENLTGTRPDDVRSFTVQYPDDFSSQGLAGKEIEYTATVTAVRRKALPEIDDEWAQSLGEEVESFAALREKLRADMEMAARAEAERRLRDEAMRKLIEAHQFEVPQTLVESQTRHLLETYVRDMLRRGIDPRNQEVNWETMGEVVRGQAVEDLRGTLLLESIAEAEDVEPTGAEIEREIESLAKAMGQTVEQVRAALTKQNGERSIADRLRHRKALELIIEHANVSDEEWREDEFAMPTGEGAETATGQKVAQAAGAPAGDEAK
ncbi:MAG: trigger factor, partial [Pyrinomonadaceae bacterium]